jgi:hypothetical protein
MPFLDSLRKSNRYDYWITFALLLVILILRSSSRLLDPIIWAEDSVYISGILEHGFFDIFKAQYGYHQTVQRLVCWCVMLFPVKIWPFLLTSICYFIYSGIFSIFSKADFEDIIPSRFHRILACTVFAFLPGTNEILGNSPNLGWILTAYVGLMGLKKLGQKPSWWEIGLSAACMSGAGQTSIMIPLFCYRLFLIRRFSPEFKRYLTLIIIQILFIYLNILAKTSNDANPSQLPSLIDLWTAWFYGTVNGILLQPLLGTHWTHVIGSSARSVWGFFALSTALATIYLFIQLEKSKKLGIAFVLSWTSAILLCSIVRGWGNVYYSSPILIEDSRSRSSFVLAIGAVFLYFSLIPHLKWRGQLVSRIGIPTFCLWYILLNGAGDNFIINSFRVRPQAQWSKNYSVLESAMKTGCPNRVQVTVEPPGWQIEYQAPNPQKVCI